MRVRNKIIILALIPLSMFLLQSIFELQEEYEIEAKTEVMYHNLNSLHALSNIIYVLQLERGKTLLYQNGSNDKSDIIKHQHVTDSVIYENLPLIAFSTIAS